MIVYRVCKKEEIDTILNDHNFQNVGKFCQINDNLNTHSYADNKRYIHFFKDKASIFYVDLTQDMFICTYNIPNYLLEKFYGVGFYLDRFAEESLEVEELDEYAIENEFINFDYLLKIERILEPLSASDYYSHNAKTETVYFNSEIINNLSNQDDCTKALVR